MHLEDLQAYCFQKSIFCRKSDAFPSATLPKALGGGIVLNASEQAGHIWMTFSV